MDRDNRLEHRCLLLENREIVPGWHLLELRAPDLVHASPGQFVQLRVGRLTDPLLRRPVSIHYAKPEKGRIRLLFRVAGRGTALVSGFKAGDNVDLLGPLGRGFPCLDEEEPAIFVAGGIGLAPLFFAAAQRSRVSLPFEFFLGGKSGSLLPPEGYFQAHGIKPRLVTDDGSRGGSGPVTALLEEYLETNKAPLRIHACGPGPMLAGVVELARSAGAAVHVSLESRMACGVGACLGCVYPFRSGDQVEYRRVCREGPVFNGEEVLFES